MRLEGRKPSGREKDEASIKLLERLSEKLYSDDSSTARRAAFNLSWMQEDGLDILKEALFGGSSKRAKNAAVYGMRCMQGRMRKMALNVLEQGLKHRNINVRNACSHALSLISRRTQGKSLSKGPAPAGRFAIREIPEGPAKREPKWGRKREIHRKGKDEKSCP